MGVLPLPKERNGGTPKTMKYNELLKEIKNGGQITWENWGGYHYRINGKGILPSLIAKLKREAESFKIYQDRETKLFGHIKVKLK